MGLETNFVLEQISKVVACWCVHNNAFFLGFVVYHIFPVAQVYPPAPFPFLSLLAGFNTRDPLCWAPFEDYFLLCALPTLL